MKLLITGATGLIGTELVKLCIENGNTINYLTTSKDKIQDKANYFGYYWNPKNGIIDENTPANPATVGRVLWPSHFRLEDCRDQHGRTKTSASRWSAGWSSAG